MAKPQKSQLTARQKRMLSDYQQRQHASAQTIEPSVRAIDSIEFFYKALNGCDEIKAKALLMLMLRNWLTDVSNFDPVSGHALHTGIIDFLDAVAKSVQDESPEGDTKDRIYRIASHSKEAVLAIMEHTRDKILREHAMLPIHAAREVDSNSVQWLSRQPGRTLREKLSGKPYMKAVRRRSSVDTAENRLLRAFLFRLEQILIERQNVLSSAVEVTCEELLVSIQRWLRTEDVAEIGTWGNLPPNNTLLQDKRYRKVWDAWLWLQAIDEQITQDSQRINTDSLIVLYWNTLSLLNESGRFRTVQQPVGTDYDNFAISPVLPLQGYLFSAMDNNPPAKEIPVVFNLKDNKWEIQVGDQCFLLTVDAGSLVIAQAQKEITRYKIEEESLKEIPKKLLSLVTDAPFEYSKPTSNQGVRLDSSVVDLCSIRPTFINNTGSQAHLPFRLLQQTWTLNDDMKYAVDCGDTKAIALRSDVETVSMRSLFLHSGTLSDATKSSASMFFTKKLSEYLKADKLTYLVPDWGNDFDLEGIRKSVNFYFDKSTPLPKSIAAIFAWQSSDEFKKMKLCKDCEILVIDSFYGGFSVTPAMTKFSEEVKAKLPETKGITWERHPAFLVDNKHIQKNVINELEKMQCPYPEDVVQLFGLDGLSYEAGKLTLEKDNKPYHIPCDISDRLRSVRKNKTSDTTTDLKKYLENREEKNIFVLQLSQSVILDPLLKKYKSLDISNKVLLTEGALTLESWQKRIDDIDIALWRDHLPELSIRIVRDGHFENFYLVKDATVTPQRGRTVNIPVEESFTLPDGQTHYSFPLQQGEGNKELQFVAYLKSPAFPLKKATACKLKMTYTYGADDPFELKFIPLDSAEAGFKSIRVEWRSASEGEAADLENLPVPDFPDRKSWSDFQKFPDKQGKLANLLHNITNEIDWLDSIMKYGRVTADISSNWKTNNRGNRFCFAGDIYLSEHSFDLLNGQELPKLGDSIQFYKIESRGKFQARNITLECNKPRRLFSPKFYFSLFTIWNNGHSLSESDVPENFRNAIFEGTQKIISIIELENMPDTLKEELFFFLCCLHKDAPGIVGSQLLDAVKDIKFLWRYYKNIAFAIGNAELPYQQELLENIIDNKGLTRSTTMEILSIALWRSKTLINKLTKEELGTLSENLYDCLEFDLQKVVNDGKGYQIATLCKHLELLLALLRSRGIEGEEFKMILAPDNDLTQKYVILVDDVSRIVIDSDIELKSRISLQIEKPEMFRNTPNLLYALRMYLTGDSGANTIVITGVSDED